jgi:rod shape-determining protein MreC
LAVLERLGGFGRNLSRLIDLDRTFRSLEARGLLVRLERLRCAAVEAENKRLTGLLNLKSVPRFAPLPARVWTLETTAGFHSLIIHRGEKDGVRPADPVIVLQEAREAVLGQVAEVYQETARVTVLTDPSSALSASVPRTSEQGVVEGSGPSRLVLNYLLSDTDVRQGDEVVTAGLGEVFPQGLLIGTVESLEAPGPESFRKAFVKPAVRSGRMSEVVVLRRIAEGKAP